MLFRSNTKKLTNEINTLKKTIESHENFSQMSLNPIPLSNRNSTPNDSIKLSYGDEFATKINPFFNVLEKFLNCKNISSVMEILESSFKKALFCDSMLILTKRNDTNCEGILFEKKILFQNLDKLFLLNGPTIYNSIAFDDLFSHTIQTSTL